MKFCKYCGYQETEDNAKFCEKCGKPFSNTSVRITSTLKQKNSSTQNVLLTMNKEELKSLSSKKILFTPSVTQLSNIRSKCCIPKQESIIAIIDNTVFGSAKSGIALTPKGMYYKADFDSPFFVSWNELSSFSFETGFLCIKFFKNGEKIFEYPVSGGDMNASELLTFLHKLQEYLTDKEDDNLSSNFEEDADFNEIITPTPFSNSSVDFHNYYDLPMDEMLSNSPLNNIFHFNLVKKNLMNIKNRGEEDFKSILTDFFTITMLDFIEVNKSTVNSKLLKFIFGNPLYYFLLSCYLDFYIRKWIGKYAKKNNLPIDKVFMVSLGISEEIKQDVLLPILREVNDGSEEEIEELLNFTMNDIDENYHGVISEIIGDAAINNGLFSDYNSRLKLEISDSIVRFITEEEINWSNFFNGLFV